MGMIGNTLAQGLISGANIVDGTVDTPDIKDSAVTAGKIATGVVTPGKLSTGAPTWDSDGKFGIGSTSPTQRLVVQDTSTVHTAVNITNGSGNYNIGVTGPSNTWGAGAGALVLRDSSVGATRMVIDSSGNVGVGTPSPNARLHLNTSGSSIFLTLQCSGGYGYVVNDGTYVSLASDIGSTGIKFRVARAAPDNAATIAANGHMSLSEGMPYSSGTISGTFTSSGSGTATISSGGWSWADNGSFRRLYLVMIAAYRNSDGLLMAYAIGSTYNATGWTAFITANVGFGSDGTYGTRWFSLSNLSASTAYTYTIKALYLESVYGGWGI